jgi:apolipoprotein N-acyltransferase
MTTSAQPAPAGVARFPARADPFDRGRHRLARLAGPLVAPGMAALGAVLISLALPPADMTPLAWVCLVPFLAAIRSCRTPARSAACSTIFVLLFGSVFSAWLPGTVAAFFHMSPLVAWLCALGVYAAFGFLPIGLFAALAHGMLHRQTAAQILIGVPCLWVATELLRVHLLGGLPWALLGHTLYRQPSLIQVADATGVFGVSFVVATVNAGIFLAVCGPGRGRRTLFGLATALGLVAATWLYGRAALATARVEPRLQIGILQPNRPPVYHWTRLEADRALISYVRLSRQQFTGRRLDLVLWPENAIPMYPEGDRPLQAQLARLAAQMGAPLILGAPGVPRDGDDTTVFNAAHLITPSGLAATYRKQRLVPFAEYSPVGTHAISASGPKVVFGTGDAPAIFTHAGIRWGPSICLDFVFADVVRSSVRAGAEVLVNLSNDSWLMAGGPGAAAQQHAQAVFRAVENRRDVARATTTGISAVITAGGEVRALRGEGETGALVAGVTPRHGLSLYTRWGDGFALGCALLGAFCPFAAQRRRHPQ